MLMPRGRSTQLAVLGCLWVIQPAVADSVSLTPVKDNSVFHVDPETSNGQGDLFCGTTGAGTVQRCLLAFDVGENVPAGSTITSVSLTLSLVRGSDSGSDQPFDLHRLTRDWGEGTSTATGGGGAAATAGDATWSFGFFSDESQMWATAGGDFEASASAGAMIGTQPMAYVWESTPQLVADVQSWLDDPGSNFGWILIGNETGGNTARRFASRETEMIVDRPTLTIEFEPPDQDGDGSNGSGLCGTGTAVAALFCLFAMTGIRGVGRMASGRRMRKSAK